MAILSSAIPYTLEMEALRRMPAGVFGVLMCIEPAVAALAGFVVLGEGLATRELVAILLVVAASAGAARNAPRAAAGRLSWWPRHHRSACYGLLGSSCARRTALMAGRMGSRSYMLSGWPQALHHVTRARPSKSTTSSQCGQR